MTGYEDGGGKQDWQDDPEERHARVETAIDRTSMRRGKKKSASNERGEAVKLACVRTPSNSMRLDASRPELGKGNRLTSTMACMYKLDGRAELDNGWERRFIVDRVLHV